MSPDPTIVEQIVAQAAEIFGGREAAEAWMSRPVMGLDRKRPLDCLHTEEGAQVVRDFLVRLDSCVYN